MNKSPGGIFLYYLKDENYNLEYSHSVKELCKQYGKAEKKEKYKIKCTRKELTNLSI